MSSPVVNHVVESIKRDLAFLKSQQHLSPQAYDDMVRILSSSTSSGALPAANSPYRSSVGSMPSPASNNYTSPPPPAYPSTTLPADSVKALYDYQGQNPQDLSFKAGDIIQVVERVNSDWWRGQLHGQTGLFPQNYTEKHVVSEKAAPPPMPTRDSKPPGGYGAPPASSSPYQQQQTSAYSPPPQASSYASYQQPPAASAYPPPPPAAQPYGNYPPPPAQAAPAPPVQQAEAGGSSDGKNGMMKRFAGKLGDAATLGFGATLGSEAAHAIF